MLREFYYKYLSHFDKPFAIKGQGIFEFPVLGKKDRILIVAPHPDDDIIGCGGLIQKAVSLGVSVKVVYLTSGDNNIFSAIIDSKKIIPSPDAYLELGKTRMQEAIKAAVSLGLKQKDLIFLCYPGSGIEQMSKRTSTSVYVSKFTGFGFNPYADTNGSGKLYTRASITKDLKNIVREFGPTIIITSHPKDSNSDHKGTFRLVRDVSEKAPLYSFLVHFSTYPRIYGSLIFPPEALVSKKGWFSFKLTDKQIVNKKKALETHLSQHQFRFLEDFLCSFATQNEIFEKIK